MFVQYIRMFSQYVCTVYTYVCLYNMCIPVSKLFVYFITRVYCFNHFCIFIIKYNGSKVGTIIKIRNYQRKEINAITTSRPYFVDYALKWELGKSHRLVKSAALHLSLKTSRVAFEFHTRSAPWVIINIPSFRVRTADREIRKFTWTRPDDGADPRHLRTSPASSKIVCIILNDIVIPYANNNILKKLLQPMEVKWKRWLRTNELSWSMLHSTRKCSECTQGLFKNKSIRRREENLRLRAWFSWSRDEKNGDNTGSSQWLKAPLGDCRFVTVSWRNVTSARDGGGRLWEWKMIREKLLHSFRLFPPEGTFAR